MLPEGPYNPITTELEILKWWHDNKLFKPEYDIANDRLLTKDEMLQDKRESFTIIDPPPNAYGRPHIGNVSGYAYQDVFGRYNRMRGKKVLLQPGKDHAGQEGESVFIRDYLLPRGNKKSDFVRDDFYAECYEYISSMAKIARQDEMRIGLSADFDRDIFTLDPKVVPTILETFTLMFKDKMVYKGVRIINWSPGMQSAVSDNDTSRVERESDLVYIKYPLEKGGYIEVATTRPETILGDTAVVVDPTDDRYQDLIGEYCMVPIINRRIPIIANGKIDKEFGTGVLKLTPAHASDDYYMSLEWNALAEQLNRTSEKGKIFTEALGYVDSEKIDYWKDIRSKIGEISYINVIWKDSKMTGPVGNYKGMTVEECRTQIIEDLNKLGLINKIEKLMQNIVLCDRTKTVVEPIMSSQWFIDVNQKNFRQNAISALQKGLSEPEGESDDKVVVHPNNMTDKALFWLNNLRDWPISRSIWWGYRIPVWYKDEPKEFVDENGQVKYTIGSIEVEDMNSALEKGLMLVQAEKPEGEWVQDPDCLDTWFSSGQWPFATLIANGLMDPNTGVSDFYPTNILETAYDILEVWVCRMIMFSMYRYGKVPFHHVYLHGLINAQDGQKMSKSKKNIVSIDEVVEKYGADTLRLFYIVGNKAGAAYRVDWEKIEGHKRFLNKLWNASKFVLMNVSDVKPEDIDISSLSIDSNKEMVTKAQNLQADVIRLIDDFHIGIAAHNLINEFWHTFCDIDLELAKKSLYVQKDKETGNIINEPSDEAKSETKRALLYVLRMYVKMLHPFIPFITEELWKYIPKAANEPKSISLSNII